MELGLARKDSRGIKRLLIVLGLFAAAGFIYIKQNRDASAEYTNYLVSNYETPSGWLSIKHSPQTLFLYRSKKTNLLLRGAVNQVIADYNPTPELHTEGIADYYLDRTKENLAGWTGKKLDTVDAKGARFRLIRRESQDKCVVTAFAVKGNTTVVVSLSANRNEKPMVDGTLDEFKGFLQNLVLTESDLSKL